MQLPIKIEYKKLFISKTSWLKFQRIHYTTEFFILPHTIKDEWWKRYTLKKNVLKFCKLCAKTNENKWGKIALKFCKLSAKINQKCAKIVENVLNFAVFYSCALIFH